MSSGRGLVHVTTPTSLHWRDVIKVPRTLRYVVAVRYEVSTYQSRSLLLKIEKFNDINTPDYLSHTGWQRSANLLQGDNLKIPRGPANTMWRRRRRTIQQNCQTITSRPTHTITTTTHRITEIAISPTRYPLTRTACTHHTLNWLHIHHAHAVLVLCLND